jgi:hypothetical protein
MHAPAGHRASRIRAAAIAAVAAALIALAGASPAAAKPYSLGFDSVPQNRIAQTKEAGADIIRIDVNWDDTAPTEPVNPTDPADPTYNWGPVDNAVKAANAQGGLRIMLTVARAPLWAQGADRPGNADVGVWKPDAQALGQFAEALAKRYSGSFQPITELSPLPRVDVFEAWNEPNLGDWLSPQYKGKKPVAIERYRDMLNAFYEGVHRAQPDASVIGGSTGPFGETPPDAFRTRPLLFARELFCLNKKLKDVKCKDPVKFDIWGHHPINIHGGARRPSLNRDDLSSAADTKRLEKALNAAEKQKTLGTKGNHPMWATEIWWETNPPDNRYGFPLQEQARNYQESFYLLNKSGFDATVVFQFIDSPVGPQGWEHTQSGVLFDDGTPKPSYTAVRFPFVTDRLSKKKIRVWSVPPVSGRLEIQESSGKNKDFRTIDSISAQAGQITQTKVKVKGRADMRGLVGSEASLSFFQPKGQEAAVRETTLAPRSEASVPPSLAPYVEESPGA